jgi:hypothetical protein
MLIFLLLTVDGGVVTVAELVGASHCETDVSNNGQTLISMKRMMMKMMEMDLILIELKFSSWGRAESEPLTRYAVHVMAHRDETRRRWGDLLVRMG